MTEHIHGEGGMKIDKVRLTLTRGSGEHESRQAMRDRETAHGEERGRTGHRQHWREVHRPALALVNRITREDGPDSAVWQPDRDVHYRGRGKRRQRRVAYKVGERQVEHHG